MSPTNLRWIAIGLAVLLLVWGGSELVSRGSDTVTGSLALPALSEAAVDTITLVKGSEAIVLARQSSAGWSVNGRPAAASAVGDLLRALKDSTRPELVAEDPSSFARLNVDSATGRWLRVRGGGTLRLALIAGARGPELQSVYLRRPGDTHVYLWRGPLASVLDRSADDWRDNRIASLDPDSVALLDVTRGTERYTLRRGGTVWTLNGGKADSTAVARYLERLRAIMAQGFATPQQADSIRSLRPTRRLVVRGERGALLLSLAFDSAAAGFLVRHVAGRGGDAATVYRMNVWDVDGVTPASRSLGPTKQ